jgi:DNA-binding NarL/FixJ family response regulator
LKHRVLVVEDHEWWRRYISAELDGTPEWQVVGTACDGIEGVQKARDLKPDVVLLDVGLPGMDGLQVARHILAHDPSSRIVFLTEQQSLEIAGAALGIGARGFVAKSDAGRDLLPAMEAVVEGERFVGAKMAGRRVEPHSDLRIAGEMHRHEAGFYPDESSLLDGYATFVAGALAAGNGLVMVFTRPRRDRLHERLLVRGINLDCAIADGRCLWLDVPAVLSTFMVDDRIDEARFWNSVSAVVMEAASISRLNPPRVSACGECAPTLLQEGLMDAAIRLEQLWDDVTRTFNVDVFCGYPCHGLRCDDESEVFRDLRAAHSAVHVG